MAKKKKLFWGILIAPEMKRKKLLGELIEEINYNTFIAKREKGTRFFITSSAIRKIIRENNLSAGLMGSVTRNAHLGHKVILATHFFPFRRLTKYFEGKGIATAIEKRIERDLVKRYPGFNIVSKTVISARRKEQLERKGRKSEIPEPVAEALRKTEAYARRKRRQFKKPLKPKEKKPRRRPGK